jgi:hypothetical protein
MQIEIPNYILEFSKKIAPKLVPNKRASGWAELPTEKRGAGDLMDLIGSLILFDKISSANKICKLDITCGSGDKSDLEIRIKNSFKKINIKTSSYYPFRDGLNLYVKEEELNKNIDAYVQVFVHLDEIENGITLSPHVHVAGWIPTISDMWLKNKENIIIIPKTDGHKGIKIPTSKLANIDKMISMIDEKF